jgi:hypothetical protein
MAEGRSPAKIRPAMRNATVPLLDFMDRPAFGRHCNLVVCSLVGARRPKRPHVNLALVSCPTLELLKIDFF